MTKKIIVAAEMYSNNLGDGIIFDAINKLITDVSYNKINIEALDLSGKEIFSINPCSYIEKQEKKSKLKTLLSRFKLVKKIYFFTSWILKDKSTVKLKWSKIIKESDAVIIGGGQLITDENFYFPPRLYLVYKLCKIHKKPLAIFGCGVGNKWGFFARRTYSKVLNYADFVSTRDNISNEKIQTLGINSIHHSDPAFYLSSNNNDNDNDNNIYFNIQSPSDFRYFVPTLKNMTDNEYYFFWINLITEFNQLGYKITLHTNGHPQDIKTINLIYSLYEKSHPTSMLSILEPAKTPNELITQLKNCTMLISTRMHAGIIAYSMLNKVIPISWDRKVNNVWAEFGTPDIPISPTIFINGISAKDLLNKLNNSKENQIKLLDNNLLILKKYMKECLFSINIEKINCDMKK